MRIITLTTTLLKVAIIKQQFQGLYAKIPLTKNSGFSPSQLIFGQNTNLPNLNDNKLLAQKIKITRHCFIHNCTTCCKQSIGYH